MTGETAAVICALVSMVATNIYLTLVVMLSLSITTDDGLIGTGYYEVVYSKWRKFQSFLPPFIILRHAIEVTTNSIL